MKANSDSYPQAIEKSAGKTQVRYDIKEVTRIDMDKNSYISYDFSYVEIKGNLTREKIINAIIENEYTKDAEIALINNEIANEGTSEYTDYQNLRAQAKILADSI